MVLAGLVWVLFVDLTRVIYNTLKLVGLGRRLYGLIGELVGRNGFLMGEFNVLRFDIVLHRVTVRVIGLIII